MGLINGFSLSVAFSALSTLIVVPILVGTLGAGTWSVIALGQSIGAIAAVAVGWGWSLSGTPSLSRATNDAQRYQIVVEASTPRFVIFMLTLIVGAGVGLLTAPETPWLATISAVAYGAQGLSLGWAFVGLGRGWQYAAIDTLPRVALTIAGSFATAWFGAWIFPVAVLAGYLACWSIAAVVLRRSLLADGTFWSPLKSMPRSLKAHVPGLLNDLPSSIYLAMPLVAVSVLAPMQLANFALLDRLGRSVKAVVYPFVQVHQHRVFSATDFDEAARKSVQFFRVFGVVVAVLFVPMAFVGGPLLAHGTIHLSLALVSTYAVGLGLAVASMGTGWIALVGSLKLRALATSTLVSASTALVLLLPLTLIGGGVGAALVVVTAEAIAHVLQSIAYARSRD